MVTVSEQYKLEQKNTQLKKIVEKCKRLHSQTFIQDMMTLKEEVNYLNHKLEQIEQFLKACDCKYYKDHVCECHRLPPFIKKILASKEKK